MLPSTRKTSCTKDTNEPTKTELDMFFKYSLDIIVLVSFDNRIKQVSPSFERILGWKKEEVISKSFQFFIHPDDRQRSLAESRAHETGKDAVRFENRYRCKEGGYRWISWNSHPLPEMQITIGIGRDVTELKKAEEALRSTETLLRSVTNGSQDAIYVKDRQSHWLFANPALERIVGKPSAEFLGKTDSEIYGYNEASKAIMENDRRIVDSGQPETFEESVEYPDGRHWLHHQPLGQAHRQAYLSHHRQV